ncbi:glycoside hydrolase family 16 protein [Leadbettera azotonutricia]|uniref:Glucan endo-1,3-beta-D-glucosidase n=1 Tax=Leadbettera azotonutricia (strain ATCC BAA-888 / DSM 13862 / ZAS-9) TaxID=545695 RepID=F5Y752_LEAAZ|nr:glycoside hydrolase family 16 protein [Leadbettera azotonutricia]AEF82958.1 glucan endo-1,3-beta-D-glucosidase [Leadbettera azotonutricia ZAS-9]
MIIEKTTKIGMAFFMLLITLLMDCSCIKHVESFPENEGTGASEDYQLIWEDNFDGSSIDTSNWIVVRWGADTVPAGELEIYQPSNVTMEEEPVSGNSCMVLTAKIDTNKSGKGQITSGRVDSYGKRQFQYGKIEASIKLPKTANGLWPAFWMLGTDEMEIGWPMCGEIDIMEMGSSYAYKNNTQETLNFGTIHYGPREENWEHPMIYQWYNNEYSLQDGSFHLYTLIWDENRINMFLDMDRFPDRAPYFSQAINFVDKEGYNLADFFRKPFRIIFNLAVGGEYPDIYEIDGIKALNATNNFEAKMYIDFVRVLQK